MSRSEATWVLSVLIGWAGILIGLCALGFVFHG